MLMKKKHRMGRKEGGGAGRKGEKERRKGNVKGKEVSGKRK